MKKLIFFLFISIGTLTFLATFPFIRSQNGRRADAVNLVSDNTACDFNRDGKVDAIESARCGSEAQALTAIDSNVKTVRQVNNEMLGRSSAQTPAIYSPFGFHPGEITDLQYDKAGFSDANYLGAQWTRSGLYGYWSVVQADLAQAAYDFSQNDRSWQNMPSNMNILANISPGPEMVGPDDKQTADRYKSGSWEPIEQAKYSAFVAAFVERYDGDGKDDMPGLRSKVRYWQVGNEFNLNKDRRGGIGVLQRITYQAIKKADPGAKVLMGGPYFERDQIIDQFDQVYYPALKELKGKYIDIFDIHTYGNATGDYQLKDNKNRDIISHIKNRLKETGFPDIYLWSAEGGTYSGAPTGYSRQSERQQANDLVRRYVYLASRGVWKLYWAWGLMEGFKDVDGYFDHTGLIYDGQGTDDAGLGTRKLGYYAYKRIAESLDGYYWNAIQTVKDGAQDKIHLYRYKNGRNRYKWVAWYDCYQDSGCSRKVWFKLGQDGKIKITELIPDAQTGQAVTKYPNAFKSYAVSAESQAITITLTDKPVLIEKY